MDALSGGGMSFDGRFPVYTWSGGGMGFDGRLPVDAWSGGGMGFNGRLPLHAMPRMSCETIPPPPHASKTLIVSLTFTKLNPPFMHRGGDPFILCFVDLTNPAYAAMTLSALQDWSCNLFVRIEKQSPLLAFVG
ncbi:RNA-binding protein 2-like [Rhododendron vialii]|uniref:RNA-binding protein 2-like n=1 Tax=Rhododendron vialii TaxID=182163 RepID=UPI00265FC6C7|nr:RNA-binding protein 2-like [Rhododendron vialii]